jgi:FAD:protein FMN transferase
VLLASCSSTELAEPGLHTLRGEALGTTWTVKYLAEVDDPRVLQTTQAVLAQVDERMSTWRDDSELSRVRLGGPVEVSEETYAVISAALELSAMTDGAFDPTVQPLMELWGLHGTPLVALPSDQEVNDARGKVDWRRIELARFEGQPVVDAHGAALDLSAIAKGHAVDRVANAVSALGHADVLVEVGGEVRAFGHNVAGLSWRLGIDAPTDRAVPGEKLAGFVELTNAGLATSGNYRNHYSVGGVNVTHTLDPRTGRPAETDVLSVSVVAPNCRTADGLATALMVLGPHGLNQIEALPDVEALMFVSKGNGWERLQTKGMPSR